MAAFAPAIIVVLGLVLVFLATPLDGAFVVGVEADSGAGFAADSAALLVVGTGACRGGFFEEEI